MEVSQHGVHYRENNQKQKVLTMVPRLKVWFTAARTEIYDLPGSVALKTLSARLAI